ncbi:hypothetical protein RchiOBHm_Chr2g0097761 [Rosa chinensis]|uniref:Uncharacterized protein n=1 Tax=Rosa chinensis TaxID=74649 RepID=A0A2P6RLJ0_ROSCH|nr:hypothetical protein RchiOBHm_Chr2g0097761 [Rosa chinensis]
MRNNLGTILLLLFLCLFVTVGFLFYCYSDSRNSLQPHSLVVLHSDYEYANDCALFLQFLFLFDPFFLYLRII